MLRVYPDTLARRLATTWVSSVRDLGGDYLAEQVGFEESDNYAYYELGANQAPWRPHLNAMSQVKPTLLWLALIGAVVGSCTSPSSSARNRALVEDLARCVLQLDEWRRLRASADLFLLAHDLEQRVANAETILATWRADRDPPRSVLVTRMSRALGKFREAASALLNTARGTGNADEAMAIFEVKLQDARQDLIGVAAAIGKPTPLFLTDRDRKGLSDYLGGVLRDRDSSVADSTQSRSAELWTLRVMRGILRLGHADTLFVDST